MLGSLGPSLILDDPLEQSPVIRNLPICLSFLPRVYLEATTSGCTIAVVQLCTAYISYREHYLLGSATNPLSYMTALNQEGKKLAIDNKGAWIDNPKWIRRNNVETAFH